MVKMASDMDHWRLRPSTTRTTSGNMADIELIPSHAVLDYSIYPVCILRYWQTRTHCCGHIVAHDVSWAAQTGKHLLRTQSVSEQNQEHFCVPDTKFVSATNVARAGKRGNICVGNNVSATMCPRLPVPLDIDIMFNWQLSYQEIRWPVLRDQFRAQQGCMFFKLTADQVFDWIAIGAIVSLTCWKQGRINRKPVNAKGLCNNYLEGGGGFSKISKVGLKIKLHPPELKLK